MPVGGRVAVAPNILCLFPIWTKSRDMRYNSNCRFWSTVDWGNTTCLYSSLALFGFIRNENIIATCNLLSIVFQRTV